MKKAVVKFTLPVSIFREEKHFIAYTPALDLSTSGKTFAEAKQRFAEAVNIFFNEVAKKETLNDVLKELGWKKVQKKWSPPPLVAHMPEEVKVQVAA